MCTLQLVFHQFSLKEKERHIITRVSWLRCLISEKVYNGQVKFNAGNLRFSHAERGAQKAPNPLKG